MTTKEFTQSERSQMQEAAAATDYEFECVSLKAATAVNKTKHDNEKNQKDDGCEVYYGKSLKRKMNRTPSESNSPQGLKSLKTNSDEDGTNSNQG